MIKDNIMILDFGNDNERWILKLKDIDQPYVINYDDFKIILSVKVFTEDKEVLITKLFKALFKLLNTCDCDTCKCDNNEKYSKYVTFILKYNPNIINDLYSLLLTYHKEYAENLDKE
jgi:hypothetical protein